VRRTLIAVFVLLGITRGISRAADDLPAWAQQEVGRAVPAFPASVTSVVLFQEEAVAVDADGRRVMRERGAIRILQSGGQPIEAVRTYNTKNGRIRDFQGWLVPPTGKPAPYAKNSFRDVALSREYVFDEARAKVLECGIAAPGSVFAWEVTEEEKTVFTQDAYQFQHQSPVLTSRFVLTLPAGWEATGIVFNRDGVEPTISNNTTYTWELHDLPVIEREAYSPTLSGLAPRLVVNYYPPANNRGGLRGLKDWAAVSSWLSALVDPAADVTDPVRTKAIQLTANAPTEIDKIRAIAAFAQQTNYVEVALNITRGGGYTPHRAEETLSKNYGDCKDNATLMRALLKAVGIDSYLTTVYASDPSYVRAEWPSPTQFNHAIVAVRVSEEMSVPTILPDTPLGRLLIFDPTDHITRLGDLPRSEQGSRALVVAGARGTLVTLPVLPPSANRIESSVMATVEASGHLDGRIQREYFGQSAVPWRRLEVLRGGDELRRSLERSFARTTAGLTLSRATTEMHHDEERLSVTCDVTSERFAQSMQGRLFVVRPGLLTYAGDYVFLAKQRTTPIRLESNLRHDSVRIKLPAGFAPDGLPPSGRIRSAYGNLETNWTVRDGEIVMDQTLQINDSLVPAADYAKVRDFFERVAGAQGVAVVAVKQ
jgi:hypothetical protein